jgi:DNA-binding CsgD family transcriptional regulator
MDSLQAVVELAFAAPGCAAFQRDLLGLLERDIGYDVAFLLAGSRLDRGAELALAGLDDDYAKRLLAAGAAYDAELSSVKRAAIASGGVAVDTAVLGTSVRRARYHRELVGPGGGHSLLCYLGTRGRPGGVLMLGRVRGFGDGDLERVRRLRPAIALGLATFAHHATVEGRTTVDDRALTPREQDIAAYLSLGYTNREIALALGLSPHTVRNQLAALFVKTGVSTRTELVGRWVRR